MFAYCGRPRSADFRDRFPYIGHRYARKTIAEICSTWDALATALITQTDSFTRGLYRSGRLSGARPGILRLKV